MYDAIRGVIAGDTALADRNGRAVLRCEQILHIDPEHALNNGLQQVELLAVPACYFYASLHFLITPAVLLGTYRYRPAVYRRVRTELGVLTALALVGFWLLPTAPPRLLPGAGFHDTLVQYSRWGWWSSDASMPAGSRRSLISSRRCPHCMWRGRCGAPRR